MKKCKKVLALVLALVMLLSAACVGLNASAISAKDKYTGSALVGSMNAADQYELTNAQYASIILDFADKMLSEGGMPKMTISATAGITIVVDLTSINGINGTIVGIAEKLNSLGTFLGDLKNLKFGYFTTSTERNGTTARDVAFITALVNFLKDETNASLIARIIRYGIGSGENQVSAGAINSFLPDEAKEITKDIVGFLKETLFKDRNASFDANLASIVSEMINGLEMEMLDGYKFESTDSIYLTIDKIVRSLTKWAVKNLQDDTWGFKEMILTAEPEFEEKYPFIDLDGFTKINWDWQADGMGTKFVSGNASTYIIYHVNNLLGELVSKLVPSFNDATSENYTGGWTKDNSTNSLSTLDTNIQKAAKFADKVLNGGSFTAAEEASFVNPTKSYAMLLADTIIRQFLPGLKVEHKDIVEGNICTLIVQGLNEFLTYYIPEKALDDLYTYNEDGTVLNRSKYTESYCKSTYKNMAAAVIAKFATGYFPVTFSNTANLDSVLKDLASYFVNVVAKAGTTNDGALGTIASNETVYTAVDRIIFSLNASGAYVEGASSNGGRNKTGILPQGILPSSYNTSKKIVDLVFSSVENLSIGSLLKILVPNSSNTEMNTPIFPSLVCYELIRIINVFFPGTWTQKTSSLDALITNDNLATILESILKKLDMNYHIYPALKLVANLTGLASSQKMGEAKVSLATSRQVNGATIYNEIIPFINSSSTSIPSNTYFIKVENTSNGINGGYHNGSGAEMQDTPYKLRVSSITCESDSSVTVSGVAATGTVIDSASSEGFAISGSASATNKVLSFLIKYSMSTENGRNYSDLIESRIFVYIGSQPSTEVSSATVRSTVPNTIYGTPGMFSDAIGYYRTTTADATYSASSEDTVFPTALVNAGFTFKAYDIGIPSSTSQTQFNPFSVSVPSSVNLSNYYGNTYNITYKLKTKDNNVEGSSYGTNATASVNWVMFDDGGLAKLVSSYEGMELQSEDFTNATLFNKFFSELAKAKGMVLNPAATSTSASALTTAFAAEVKALTTAYENLLEVASSNYTSLLKERVVTYDEGDKENDIRALYHMWDYTPVSWARYSSSMSTVKNYLNTKETSSVKIKEALRYNEVMSKRLYTSAATDASASAAKANLQDVRSKFNANNYDPTKYTPASYEALIEAFEDADKVIAGTGLDGTSASRTSDYADARAAILGALNQLTTQPLDVDELYAKVQQLQETYNDNMYYTDEAWSVFEAAMAKANVAINDPYSLLPEDYTQSDINAVNAQVAGYITELENAKQTLIANPYVSRLVVNTSSSASAGCVTFKEGGKVIAGSKVIDVSQSVVVPYGFASKNFSNVFTMSKNVSRYTKDAEGNWNTYSSAGNSVTYQAYQDATKARTVGNTAKLKTGNVVVVTDGNGNETMYTVSVIGNDGEAVTPKKFETAYDAIANYLPNIIANVGVSSISDAVCLACDLNGDGQVDNTDLILLRKWKNGTYTPANAL